MLTFSDTANLGGYMDWGRARQISNYDYLRPDVYWDCV